MARSRSRRVLLAIGKVVLTIPIAAIACSVAAIAALDTRPVKSWIASRANRLLRDELRGRVVVERIGQLGVGRVSGIRAVAFDPTGHRVILAEGLRATMDLRRLIRSFLSGGPIQIVLTNAQADYVDLSLDADSRGSLRIVNAFEPKQKPEPPPPPSPAGQGVRIKVDGSLSRVWAHGRPNDFGVDFDLLRTNASIRVGRKGVEIVVEGSHISSRSMPAHANPQGNVTFTASLPSKRVAVFGGSFSGTVGGISTTATARLAGSQLDGWAMLAREPGSEPTLATADAWPVRLTTTVTVSGSLRRLAVHALARAGRSVADLRGSVALSPGVTASGKIVVEHLDIRKFARGAPASDVGLSGPASFVLHDGVPRAELAARIRGGGTVSGIRLPRTSVVASLDGRALRARVLMEKRGAAAHIAIQMARSAMDVVHVQANTKVQDLRRVTEGVVAGSASATVQGTIDLANQNIRGRVVMRARNIEAPRFKVARAFLESTFAGALDDPEADAIFTAAGLQVGPLRFNRGRGIVRGGIARGFIQTSLQGEPDTPSVSASTHISLSHGVTLRELSARVERDHVTALVGVSLIRLQPHGIRVDRAEILGLGEPLHASIRISPSKAIVRAKDSRIDIQKVAVLAGFAPKRVAGNLALDIDVRATQRRATGQVRAELDNAVVRGAAALARVRANFGDGGANVRMQGEWDGTRVDLISDRLDLVGPILKRATWEHAIGRLDLVTSVDLGRVRAELPAGRLLLGELKGHADIRARLERKTQSEEPALSLSVRTHHLGLTAKAAAVASFDSTIVQVPPRWRVEGVDVDIDVQVDPHADRSELHAALRDRLGSIAVLDLGSRALPLSVLARPGEATAFFERTPSRVAVAVPRRRFADLPAPFSRPNLEGTFEIAAAAQGSLLEPLIQASILVRDFRGQRDTRSPALTGRLRVLYAKSEAVVNGILEDSGREVARLSARGHLNVPYLRQSGPREFDVSARADLLGVPLESFPPLAAERITGRLYGSIESALGTNTPPTFRAGLRAEGVSIERLHDNRLQLVVDANRDRLQAAAQFQQLDGFATLRASIPVDLPVGARSGARRSARPMLFDLRAEHFRLATLRPLVEGFAGRVDGWVDGRMSATVVDGEKRASLNGSLTVSQGNVEVPLLGQGFSAIRGRLNFDPSGTIHLDDFYAEGTSGRVQGGGSLHFSGYRMDSGAVNLTIPKREPLPISFGGQVLAEASGKLHVTMTRNEDSEAPEVQFRVQDAIVDLPHQSTHELQSLEPAEGVRIGVMKAPGHFELIKEATTAPPTSSDIEGVTLNVVAQNVELRRGTDLRVWADGQPVIKTGREEGVYGTVVLRSGFLYVQGKKFELERGTITFDGPADNPQVVATAAWTAPEGSRIFADFIGPLKTGKLTLHSDPQHTKSEILSLILFGTTTGNVATTPGASGASASALTAAGFGVGFAAQGLNRALDDLTGLDVTARIDTSESPNPRPELEVRISRSVTVSVAHVLGVPPPGTNPDRNLAQFSWHLFRHWVMQATFGDQGSSLLDLVWRFRY